MGIFDDLDNLGKSIKSDLGKLVQNEFGEMTKTVGDQIGLNNTTGTAGSSHTQPDYIFTDSFFEDARGWGLSQNDALDVYHNGDKINEEILVREYNGYELGIKISHDPFSGKPVIKEIWKKTY